VILADALAAACDDAEVLACLGGPLGDAARAKAAELRRLPEAARKPARALAAARARSTSVRGIHASWLEAALAPLPARARDDLARGAFDRPAGVWLARWAHAALAPLPDADLARPRTPAEILRVVDLVEWLSNVGADQLAFAAGASRFVEPHVVKRVDVAPRRGRLGERRDAIRRCTLELDDDALLRIGARTVAPHTDAACRRALSLRLPRIRGLAVLCELQQFANTAPAGWDAIAAD
jgi:hypothetical protein